MEKHRELTDPEFETQFQCCELTPSLFTHEAHLRLAWIHITNYGAKQAEENVNNQILNYINHVGAIDKFHKTLTVIAVRLVAGFITKSNSGSFEGFIAEFPELKTNFKELVAKHYSFNIFTSEKAKKEFIEPDLLSFT